MATGGRRKTRGGRGGGSAAESRRPTVSAAGEAGPSNPTAKTKTKTKTRSPLPSQYDFVPRTASRAPPAIITNKEVHPRDYPPPQSLFQNSTVRSGGTPPPQFQVTAPHLHTTEQQPLRSHEARPSPHSSQAQNSPHRSHRNANISHLLENAELEEDALSDKEEEAPFLSEDHQRTIYKLITQPGRELYTTVLSPIEKPGATWFGRDKSSLTRKITKIFTNKFDGPYYSWTCVPRDRQERYFVEFAKTHTWDPLITGVVQEKFEKICQIRMKDMVSTARTTREKPKWMTDDIWRTMNLYWDTEQAREKSISFSQNRMSERGGLGIHKHVSGQKSFLQLEQEMEVEFGRPVTLGEVFIRAHTTKDGKFVDQKAEQVAAEYQKNRDAMLSELVAATEGDSDGTSQIKALPHDMDNECFLKSTIVNERGLPYGVGSLESSVTGKRKYAVSSSSYTGLQEKLEEAQKKLEEQAAENRRLLEENNRVAAEHQSKINHLTLLEKYLSQTDPNFLDFMASQTASTNADPTTSQQPPA